MRARMGFVDVKVRMLRIASAREHNAPLAAHRSCQRQPTGITERGTQRLFQGETRRVHDETTSTLLADGGHACFAMKRCFDVERGRRGVSRFRADSLASSARLPLNS